MKIPIGVFIFFVLCDIFYHIIEGFLLSIEVGIKKIHIFFIEKLIINQFVNNKKITKKVQLQVVQEEWHRIS